MVRFEKVPAKKPGQVPESSGADTGGSGSLVRFHKVPVLEGCAAAQGSERFRKVRGELLGRRFLKVSMKLCV